MLFLELFHDQLPLAVPCSCAPYVSIRHGLYLHPASLKKQEPTSYGDITVIAIPPMSGEVSTGLEESPIELILYFSEGRI